MSVRTHHAFFFAAAAATALAIGCGGGAAGSVDSGVPTSPTPSNPATPVSQNGCAATLMCPNADINGVADPTTPTFDTITLSTGTSATCRAEIHRNTSDPGVPISFTIRHANAQAFWRFRMEGSPPMMSVQPPSGGAASAGPFAGSAFYNGGGPNGPSIKTGDNVTQNLILELVQGTSKDSNPITLPVVAACGVTVWFTVPSGK